MIRALSIRGLGPHRATALELDPKGYSTLEGPSQSGKSTSIDAVCWVLWGTTATGKPLPEQLVHDGEEQAEVTVTLGSGTVLTRRVRRASRKTMREVTRRGEEEPTAVATEAGWRDAIGPLGKNPDLARTVMVPLAWTALAEGAGGGRPLRDLLAGVLPSSSLREVVGELMGGDLRQGDSLVEKEAYARRADKNRERDELTGQLTGAEEEVARLAQARVDQPDPAEVRAAKAALEADAAWARWRPVLEWDQRAAKLGERPDSGGHEHIVSQRKAFRDELTRKAAKLGADHAKAVAEAQHVQVDRTAVQAAQRALEEAERRANAGTKCPECGQEIPDAADRIEEAARQAEAAQAELSEAQAAYEEALDNARRAAEARVREAIEAHEAVAAELAKAESALNEALAQPNPAVAWEAARRALGARPVGPEPTMPEPDEAAVKAAGEVNARLLAAAGERKRVDADRKRAQERVQRLKAQHEAADAEAKRLDRLVEAIRRAPSVIASRQVEALGDLGPVTIRMPETGPAIEVLVDGRPWWTASRGRLIVADLHLRAALRRAMKLPWLVLFVDNVQDWSGEWPEIPGPVVMLRTAATGELALARAA